MTRVSSAAVLVSGGLDSDALLAEMAETYKRMYPIYIAQGLAWESVERYWLGRYLKAIASPRLAPLRTLAVPMDDLYRNHWSLGKRPVPGARSKDEAVYLPGRNLVLSVKAAIFCAMNRIPVLALGSLGHNPFRDAAPRFFRMWGKALSVGLGWNLTVTAPYRQKSKASVIRRWKALPLELSFSCIAPSGRKHCGRCNKCAERKKAFYLAKVEDKTIYAR
jgi:7-cyano-7-deazaguanine synthase